jgi:hypothetical protein
MGAAFTPGPWSATNHFADDSMSCNCAYVLSEGYAGGICKVAVDNGKAIGDGGNDAPPKDEAAANARLIAAAPELYAELEHARELLGLQGVIVDAIDAALAKARGE